MALFEKHRAAERSIKTNLQEWGRIVVFELTPTVNHNGLIWEESPSKIFCETGNPELRYSLSVTKQSKGKIMDIDIVWYYDGRIATIIITTEEQGKDKGQIKRKKFPLQRYPEAIKTAKEALEAICIHLVEPRAAAE